MPPTSTPPAEAKITFYLTRLLNLLFPFNFPKIHAAFGIYSDSQYQISGTIRQRIFPARDKNSQIHFPILNADQTIYSLRLPIATFDSFRTNFIIASDGGEYYVDTCKLARTNTDKAMEWDIPKIISYMKANGFSEGDIRKAIRIIERIKKLEEGM